MKISDLVKMGNFITFIYRDSLCMNRIVGKIIRLNVPKKSLNSTMDELTWRQMFDLEGYVSILTDDGRVMNLDMMQVARGCKSPTRNEVKRWKSALQKSIKTMRNNADYLEHIIES